MRTFEARLMVFLIVCTITSPLVQAQFSSKYFVTSDRVQLHYLEAGSGPTLVLVPGWTMPAEIWERQIMHFAETHHVVALDPRGQGRSEKPSFGYHPSRRARDIAELLIHLGGEPAVIAGWSIAGQEVLLCAHEYGTENIRAVVVVDWDIKLEAPERFTGRFISLQTGREEWMRNFVRACHQSPQSEEYFNWLTQAALSMPSNATAMMIANIILMGPNDLSSAIDSIDRPILYIYSSSGWAVEAAREVREGWPDVPVEVIENTSHALFVDSPEDFNRVLEKFLMELPR